MCRTVSNTECKVLRDWRRRSIAQMTGSAIKKRGLSPVSKSLTKTSLIRITGSFIIKSGINTSSLENNAA